MTKYGRQKFWKNVWPNLKMLVNIVSCHECTVLPVLRLGTVTHDRFSLTWLLSVDHFWYNGHHLLANPVVDVCVGSRLPASIQRGANVKIGLFLELCYVSTTSGLIKFIFPGRQKRKKSQWEGTFDHVRATECKVLFPQHESNIHEQPLGYDSSQPPFTWLRMSHIHRHR